MAATGALSASWADVAWPLRRHTSPAWPSAGFPGRLFMADGRPYHEAGGSEAQELAAVLATALAYLRALEAGGPSSRPPRATPSSFLLVADADEFLTVAKFRALRRLWARVEEACGLEPRPIRLHAETAWRMTTRRDPWVNMLRSTVAAFSAGIGGADRSRSCPSRPRSACPTPSPAALARNTQLILLEEANLWRVADPAAGAGGFEALTDALCEKAWGLFQEIEREGGIVESLSRGALQARIAAVRARRERAVATRREPITGTSEFPTIREADVAVLAPSPLWDRGTEDAAPTAERPSNAIPPGAGDGSPPASRTAFASLVGAAAEGSPLALAGTGVATATPLPAPLPSRRLAEPFERLRDRSDADPRGDRRAAQGVPRQSRPASRLSRPAPPSPRTCSRPAASRP